MGFEALNRIDSASGWEVIDTDDRDSTVATFAGGANCVVPTADDERGDEILIWQGVSELHETSAKNVHEVFIFEGYEDIPHGAMYVVQFHPNGDDSVVAHEFAQSHDEAVDIVLEFIEQRKGGEY